MVPQQQLILRLTDSLSQQIRATIAKQADKESNIIVEIESEADAEGKDDCFTFNFNGTKYPAVLLNLPTLIETQKTFDRKIFYKSGDIGQILYVSETESARENIKTKQTKMRNDELYYVNGLTPPTNNIIKNRFELTSKSTDNYPTHKVKMVINDIASVWSIQEEENLISVGSSSETSSTQQTAVGTEYIDIITEEVVDFQEWMVANNSNDSSVTGQTQLTLMDAPYTSKSGLRGLVYHIDGFDWNTRAKLGVSMDHPEILEAPNEENSFVIH